MQSKALLVGRRFDAGGNRMRPPHAREASIKGRYYLLPALIELGVQTRPAR